MISLNVEDVTSSLNVTTISSRYPKHSGSRSTIPNDWKYGRVYARSRIGSGSAILRIPAFELTGHPIVFENFGVVGPILRTWISVPPGWTISCGPNSQTPSAGMPKVPAPSRARIIGDCCVCSRIWWCEGNSRLARNSCWNPRQSRREPLGRLAPPPVDNRDHALIRIACGNGSTTSAGTPEFDDGIGYDLLST